MKDIYYSIANEVFAKYPSYVRGVVLAYDVKNSDSPQELISLLRAEEDALRKKMDMDILSQYPRIVSWREVYREMGIKPGKFRASMEAMARRILKDQAIPSINALVDIGNIISIKYLIPVGGHAIDVVNEDIALRPANGNEDFIPFGSDQVENPDAGEIIFTEANKVLTRRWSWRQANHTLTVAETKDIEFNVDGLAPVDVSEIQQACQDMITLIERFCGGQSKYQILSQDNTKIQIK